MSRERTTEVTEAESHRLQLLEQFIDGGKMALLKPHEVKVMFVLIRHANSQGIVDIGKRVVGAACGMTDGVTDQAFIFLKERGLLQRPAYIAGLGHDVYEIVL